MAIYNLMTMEGWGTGFQIGWIACWLSILIVFFLAFIMRRQASEGFIAGTNYNVIGALVVGLAADILLATFTGSPAWALLGGIAGVAAGGFGVGALFPMEGGGDEYGE